MAEKKGLFGRLFGKKADTDDTDGAAKEEAPPIPASAPEEAAGSRDDDERVPDASEVPPSVGPGQAGEEDADLEAAQATVSLTEEPVAILSGAPTTIPDEEEDPDPQTDERGGTPPAATMPPPVAAAPASGSAEEGPKTRGLFGRLREGLAKTSAKLSGGIGSIFTKRKLDDDTLEEFEDLLITADLGIPATTRIITTLSQERYDQEITGEEVRGILSAEICRTLAPLEARLEPDPQNTPHIILVTGVNGSGKTTTIGKLAAKFVREGRKVVLAAGDTFRAAAIEQLQIWGERTGSTVVAGTQGADAAGLAFDAIERARAEGADIVIVDTAGRLQNRRELMDELGKIVRVIRKLDETAPHHTLLVLDATVGQNALSQTEAFLETAQISGLVMTKLDGTARGGVLVALGDRYALPIHFVGVGEGVDDLQPFEARAFAEALTAPAEETAT